MKTEPTHDVFDLFPTQSTMKKPKKIQMFFDPTDLESDQQVNEIVIDQSNICFFLSLERLHSNQTSTHHWWTMVIQISRDESNICQFESNVFVC